MRPRRILLLMHAHLVPPESVAGLSEAEINNYRAELNVREALLGLGHQLVCVGLEDDFGELRLVLRVFKPHLVFNLLTHFHEAGIYDSALVGWLELHKLAYSGCNPRGLLVAGDKALAKKVLRYHRILAPRFFSVAQRKSVRRLPAKLNFPLIVKSRSEHASAGIAQASIVRNQEQLAERVDFIHRHVGTGALCEEYIEGRELTIGVLGNARLETSPVWELTMAELPSSAPNIVTARVKWNLAYQQEIGLKTFEARDLSREKAAEIARIAKRIYRAFGLSGYARIDLRLDQGERIWVLEANPYPDLSFGEDFAESFQRRGYSYPKLIEKIVALGLRYEAPWKT
jgi:D-alanine-D-alanine ligase